MSHDPARWENRTPAEAEAERRRNAANLEGALQTREIRRMPRREQVLAAQQAARPLPVRTIRQRLRDAVDAFRA